MLNTLPQPLAFEDVSKYLPTHDHHAQPSELHGMVCGLVCAGADLDGKVWIDRILGKLGSDLGDEIPGLLVRLYNQISREFSSVEFTFNIFLPDGSHSLATRTLALTQWCQGFLSGMHSAGVNFADIFTDDLVDILCRFSELAQMERSEIETTDEKILTFAELVEFIRKSVWSLYTARTFASSIQSPSSKKALH